MGGFSYSQDDDWLGLGNSHTFRDEQADERRSIIRRQFADSSSAEILFDIHFELTTLIGKCAQFSDDVSAVESLSARMDDAVEQEAYLKARSKCDYPEKYPITKPPPIRLTYDALKKAFPPLPDPDDPLVEWNYYDQCVETAVGNIASGQFPQKSVPCKSVVIKEKRGRRTEFIAVYGKGQPSEIKDDPERVSELLQFICDFNNSLKTIDDLNRSHTHWDVLAALHKGPVRVYRSWKTSHHAAWTEFLRDTFRDCIWTPLVNVDTKFFDFEPDTNEARGPLSPEGLIANLDNYYSWVQDAHSKQGPKDKLPPKEPHTLAMFYSAWRFPLSSGLNPVRLARISVTLEHELLCAVDRLRARPVSQIVQDKPSVTPQTGTGETEELPPPRKKTTPGEFAYKLAIRVDRCGKHTKWATIASHMSRHFKEDYSVSGARSAAQRYAGDNGLPMQKRQRGRPACKQKIRAK